jgi:EAL domain-containing protein (putative c-di-GMP-specific phosphodiesterase class I)
MASILICAAIGVIPHGRLAGVDPAPVGTAVVVIFAIARQRLLVVSERQASHLLAGEVEERAQTMLSLARLEQAETIEQTAYRICDEALRLVGIDSARVYAFGASSVVPLALEGISPNGEAIWEPIERGRALHLKACSSAGAWIDTPSTAAPWLGGLIGEAFAPMRWDDRIVGVVAMGTTDAENAKRLALRFPTLTEFGVVSSALLGPKLADHFRRADIRSQLDTIISTHAFMPVFQPVVQLRTREIVGFEALTRFRDGTRPDQRFMEADSVGMSVRLETACIGEQLEAATWLPQGTWLSLNVSPALASAIIPVIAALERADRDIVLEITEHVEIADYRQLMGALNLLRGKARLAVDDAGAGYAGLRHILELQPQFVKLDISLVRHVDTDAARQAMVAGMAHFAQNAGCELIAEGIETEEELSELIRLGVGLGQGYLFGKPGPALTD